MGNSRPPLPILTVDANRRNLELLDQVLSQAGYCTLPVATIDMLDQVLEEPVSLALIDISGFSADIWQRCERLHRRDVPLLIVSARQSAPLGRLSLKHGARGVLIKPLVIRELLGLIRSILS